MDTVFAIYAVLGATVLVLALSAGFLERSLWVSEPLIAMAIGIAVGPVGLGLFRPDAWGAHQRVLEELARLTLGISLMGVALRLPSEWVRRSWRPLGLLLLVGMPLMWLVSGLCGWLILGLPVLEALLLGAVLAPTDPVAASTIVTGTFAERHLDADTRHLISAESGANDGLAFLLLMLPVLLREHSAGVALERWLLEVLLLEVLGSALGGALFGWAVSRALRRVYAWKHASRGSLLAVTLAISLTLLGVVKLLGGDGILAVFAAGLVFNWYIREDEGHEEARHERVQETAKRFFDVPVFLFFGMVLPWSDWVALGWRGLAFVVAVLVLRRLPVVLALARALAPVRSLRDALFVGWFGPIAVAAMVYAGWADLREGHHTLWIVSTLTIFASLVAHGLSATPLTRWYARDRREDEPARAPRAAEDPHAAR